MQSLRSIAPASGAVVWLAITSSLVSAQTLQTTTEAQAEVVQPPAAVPQEPVPQEPTPSAPASAVSAQPAAPVPKEETCPVCEDDFEGGGLAAFLIGPGWFDLSALNDRLAAHGYERISQPVTLIGGQAHAIFDSGFVLGGMGAGILGPSGGGPGDLRTNFGGGFGMADFGFALIRTQALLLTAMGGIGGYGWSLSIHDPGATAFDEVLEDPRRGATLSRGGMLFGASLQFEGRVPVGKPERGRQGFFAIGARVGGLYGPPITDWSLDDGADLTGGPDGAMAGFYAALTVGFGGWRVEP
jgi:hypothetical protein